MGGSRPDVDRRSIGVSGLPRVAGVGVAKVDADRNGSEELELDVNVLHDEGGRVEGTRKVVEEDVASSSISGRGGGISSSVYSQSRVVIVAASWLSLFETSPFPRTSSFSSLEKRSGVTSRQTSISASVSLLAIDGESNISDG